MSHHSTWSSLKPTPYRHVSPRFDKVPHALQHSSARFATFQPDPRFYDIVPHPSILRMSKFAILIEQNSLFVEGCISLSSNVESLPFTAVGLWPPFIHYIRIRPFRSVRSVPSVLILIVYAADRLSATPNRTSNFDKRLKTAWILAFRA